MASGPDVEHEHVHNWEGGERRFRHAHPMPDPHGHRDYGDP